MLTMQRIAMTLALCLCLPRMVGAETHNVSISGLRFSPNDLTIVVGDTVRWTNGGGTHDVSADDGSWGSTTGSNWVYERTFNTVAEVLYYCSVHSQPGRNIDNSMNGRVNVVEQYGNEPPVADFTSSCIDLSCNFTDQSIDSDGSIASRTWAFGDGDTSMSTNPSHTYASAGTYSVTLNVTDDAGDADSVSKNVTVSAPGNQDPIADFTFSCADLSCTFTDQSNDPDGSIASRSWAFGDGDSSTSANPTHTYASAGTYSVRLIVTDDGGASDTRTRTVTVSEPATTFLINPAITDAWYDPLTGGQGFFIIVWEDVETVFLSWFTYDIERPPQDVTANLGEPGHRWLTAQGSYSGDTATLTLYETAGGVFDAPTPVPDPALQVGTIEIIWTGCNAGMLSYDLPSLSLSGNIPIQRIVLDKVSACEAAQP
jgi:PKD repeat protein